MKMTYPTLLLGILATTACLGFIPYAILGIGKPVGGFAIAVLLFVLFINFRKKIKDANFSKEMALLVFLPFLSSISCLIYRGQSIPTTIIATRGVCWLLIYFLLHKVCFSEDKLKKLIIKIAIFSTLVYILQQFFYPSLYLFDEGYGRPVDIRGGLYRFRLFNNNPYIFYSFMVFAVAAIKSKTQKNILWAGFFFIGIYLTLTRQIWACCLLPVFLYPILKDSAKSGKKVLGIVFSGLLLYLLFTNLGSVFGAEILQKTVSQLNDDNDIRMIALNYYGLEYWVDGWNVVFGNGVPSFGNSDYGNFINRLEMVKGLYRCDIGIVGRLSEFGAVYLFALLLYYVKVFRNFKYLSVEMKMLFIASAMNIPLASWDYFPLFLGLITYLADCDIKKNKVLYNN